MIPFTVYVSQNHRYTYILSLFIQSTNHWSIIFLHENWATCMIDVNIYRVGFYYLFRILLFYLSKKMKPSSTWQVPEGLVLTRSTLYRNPPIKVETISIYPFVCKIDFTKQFYHNIAVYLGVVCLSLCVCPHFFQVSQ